MDQSEKFEQLYTKVLKYLSYRQRSEKEIRDYLLRKKADEKMSEVIIKLLHDQAFLNDELFAKMWIESRARFNPKSKRIITLELKQKGITQEIVEKVMTEFGNEENSDDVLARKIVEQKISRYTDLPKEKQYEKLAGQLGRRGFSWDTIKKVLASYK